jgi:hypothetical protein
LTVTAPLALIEGDLALPDARLLRGLPPPFGLLPRPVPSARSASPLDAQPTAPSDAKQAASIAVERVIRHAVRHKNPVRQRPLPPGTMFRFFYKVQQPRDFSAHIRAQLAEARHYLDAGKKARARSSRRDYVLGAAIFTATGISLAWLMTISTMREAERIGPVAGDLQSAMADAQKPVSPSQSAIGSISAPSLQHNAATSIEPKRGAVRPLDSVADLRRQDSLKPTPSQRAVRPANIAPSRRLALANQRALSQSLSPAESHKLAKSPSPKTITRRATSLSHSTAPSISILTDAQLDARLALNRAVAPSAQASVSVQPEWSARTLTTDASPEQTALRNWAAQQRRLSPSAVSAASTEPAITTRASVTAMPTSTPTTTWNARMAQRRITDNPNAFDTNPPRP